MVWFGIYAGILSIYAGSQAKCIIVWLNRDHMVYFDVYVADLLFYDKKKLVRDTYLLFWFKIYCLNVYVYTFLLFASVTLHDDSVALLTGKMIQEKGKKRIQVMILSSLIPFLFYKLRHFIYQNIYIYVQVKSSMLHVTFHQLWGQRSLHPCASCLAYRHFKTKVFFWLMTVGIYRKEDDGEQATNGKWLVSAKNKYSRSGRLQMKSGNVFFWIIIRFSIYRLI